jgi:hypothetical protein
MKRAVRSSNRPPSFLKVLRPSVEGLPLFIRWSAGPLRGLPSISHAGGYWKISLIVPPAGE